MLETLGSKADCKIALKLAGDFDANRDEHSALGLVPTGSEGILNVTLLLVVFFVLFKGLLTAQVFVGFNKRIFWVLVVSEVAFGSELVLFVFIGAFSASLLWCGG